MCEAQKAEHMLCLAIIFMHSLTISLGTPVQPLFKANIQLTTLERLGALRHVGIIDLSCSMRRKGDLSGCLTISETAIYLDFPTQPRLGFKTLGLNYLTTSVPK